jgi:hypothetical protein
MNEVFDYQIKVTHVNTLLQQMMNDLYSYGINVGMRKELKELPVIFKQDKIPIDISLLAALHDPLIKPLLDLIYALDRKRTLIMQHNGLTDMEMANAFYREAGKPNWPVFMMLRSDSYMSLACSILHYFQQAVYSLFCIALQLSESRMDYSEADRRHFQYPFGEALKALNQSDPVVLLIMDTMRETHESMKIVYEIAESLKDR